MIVLAMLGLIFFGNSRHYGYPIKIKRITSTSSSSLLPRGFRMASFRQSGEFDIGTPVKAMRKIQSFEDIQHCLTAHF
jgi:hypothetical protein